MSAWKLSWKHNETLQGTGGGVGDQKVRLFFTVHHLFRVPHLRLEAQVLPDVLRQGIIDFAMARYGLFLSGGRIVVDVVAPAVSQKNTALLFKLADQLAALQSAISLVL